MKSYFDSQMRVLQEDVKSFAAQYPEHARYLNIESMHDRDPNVERLLEGFAYLTGRVQQKLDQGLMGLSESLLENLNPNSLKAMPSKAIAQYQMMLQAESDSVFKVTPDNKLSSKPVGDEETVCKFSVEEDEFIYPITLNHIAQKENANRLYEVKLDFKVDALALDFSMTSLKLYFDGESELRLSWLYGLLEQLDTAYLVYQQQRYKIDICHPYLGEQSVKDSDVSGVDTLKDFFVFHDKFMFVELKNLPSTVFQAGENIEVFFILKEALPSGFINQKNILLGCVPITNVYAYSAEPINHSGNEYSSPLVIDSSRRKSICLNEVTSVVSTKVGSPESIRYLPFRAYNKKQTQASYYRLERSASVLEANHIILSGTQASGKQCLSIMVKASNASYPRKYIMSRALTVDSVLSPSFLEGTNITKPTDYFPAVSKQEYYWHLVGMLSDSYQNLSNKQNIVNILHMHDLQNRYAEKIEAILDTSLQLKQAFRKGVLYQGVLYSITIDDTAFSSKQEIYLFGKLLHFFIFHQIEINHFLKTEIKFAHKPIVFNWQAGQGLGG